MNTPAAPGAKNAQKSFAQGTSDFPVPIFGAGAQLTASSVGGNTTTATPISKSGFLAQLRFTVTGSLTIGTAGSANYTVPLWRLIRNYTLQNSLNYPYRSLNGDDIWLWGNVSNCAEGTKDSIFGSSTFASPDMSSTGTKNFSFSFVDNIGQNDGVNFSRYLLSAMTTSNDLSILFTWLPTTQLSLLQSNGAVITAYTATCAVSATYLTVPDPTKYAWPRRNLVQQVLGDPSYNTPAVGLNVVNLTPIQGPEFTGLGVQVLSSGGTPDPLTLAASGISEIDIYVNGTIPLKQYLLSDLINHYEKLFGRSPGFGYLYLDLSSDLNMPNVMSHTHRKVLSTAKYSQISVRVTLNGNFTAGTGAVINLLKRTQQAYANNQ